MITTSSATIASQVGPPLFKASASTTTVTTATTATDPDGPTPTSTHSDFDGHSKRAYQNYNLFSEVYGSRCVGGGNPHPRPDHLYDEGYWNNTCVLASAGDQYVTPSQRARVTCVRLCLQRTPHAGTLRLPLSCGALSLPLSCGALSLPLSCGALSLPLSCGALSLLLSCGALQLRVCTTSGEIGQLPTVGLAISENSTASDHSVPCIQQAAKHAQLFAYLTHRVLLQSKLSWVRRTSLGRIMSVLTDMPLTGIRYFSIGGCDADVTPTTWAVKMGGNKIYAPSASVGIGCGTIKTFDDWMKLGLDPGTEVRSLLWRSCPLPIHPPTSTPTPTPQTNTQTRVSPPPPSLPHSPHSQVHDMPSVATMIQWGRDLLMPSA
jgi:hypothetical protein